MKIPPQPKTWICSISRPKIGQASRKTKKIMPAINPIGARRASPVGIRVGRGRDHPRGWPLNHHRKIAAPATAPQERCPRTTTGWPLSPEKVPKIWAKMSQNERRAGKRFRRTRSSTRSTPRGTRRAHFMNQDYRFLLSCQFCFVLCWSGSGCGRWRAWSKTNTVSLFSPEQTVHWLPEAFAGLFFYV